MAVETLTSSNMSNAFALEKNNPDEALDLGLDTVSNALPNYNNALSMKVRHDRDFVKQVESMKNDTTGFCRAWSTQSDRIDTHQLRARILQAALSSKLHPDIRFSSLNPPATEITTARLITLYKLVDLFFCNDTLDTSLQAAAKERKASRGFELVVKHTIPGEPLSTCFFEYAQHSDPSKIFFGIVLQSSLWGDSAIKRKVDGLPQMSKLHALLATICHELTHALAYSFCGNYEHDSTFTEMNSRIFGHSPSVFTASDK